MTGIGPGKSGILGKEFKNAPIDKVRHHPEMVVLNILRGVNQVRKVLLYNGTRALEEAALEATPEKELQ